MHQPIEFAPASRPARSDAVLRQSILRSIARDLMLPVDHPAVSGMFAALGTVSLRRDRIFVDAVPATRVLDNLDQMSLDTWCCVVAQAHADGLDGRTATGDANAA